MSEKMYYLKPNLVFEPLVDNWYAWTYLIHPVTRAMNIVRRYQPIIDSFIENPELHVQAVKNPKLRGGPFIDLPSKEVEQVKYLKTQMDVSGEKARNLVDAVKSLENLLNIDARGSSMETVYPNVPQLLKGLVELFYDRNNNPSFRFYEELLYKSDLYEKNAQSIALWLTHNDDRPFSLSTPKIPSTNTLHLKIPFDHIGIDELAKMKSVPSSIDTIKNVLGIEQENMDLFRTFFTEDVPPVYEVYQGNKIRMRYFGHACILIETNEVTILVDPLISYYGYPSSVDRFSDADIPDKIDYVLITHNHQDHILLETLLPLRHKIKTVVVPKSTEGRLEDPNLKLMLKTIGFKNVISIEELETINFKDIDITGIPFTGEHCDLNILTKSCYIIKAGNFKLMFLADSRLMEPMLYERIYQLTGGVDVMFLGMECDGAPMSWLYGPLLPRKTSRENDLSRKLSGSDCQRGLSIIDIFGPSEVYVYAMGQEPWLEFITSIKLTETSLPIVESNKLIDFCKSKGIYAERLFGEKEILYSKEGNQSKTEIII